MANEFRVKNGIICGGDILPDSDGAHDIGASGTEFQDGWFDGTVNCDDLTVSGTSTSIGTVTSGSWQGTRISPTYGGTGLYDANAGTIVIADGTGAPTTLDVGSSTAITILGTVGTGVWQGTAVALGYGGTGLVGATDGKIVIADGSGAPVHLDVGSSTAITILGTIATGTWEATDVAVAHGGTGVSTLTDGGILLGSGTSAITAMAVLSDGQMIVGDGTTDPVAESGTTLRTSIGVGTGNSPQFTGIELGHASDTTIARSSAGVITVEGVAVPTISSTSTLTNKTLTSPVLNTGVSGTAVKDEDNMSSDSATHLASQQSIKAYVDANGGLSLIDEDDMASNSDTRPPSQQSVVEYVQSEVGSAGGGDITSVVAGTGLSGGATSGAATLNMKTELVYGPTGDQTQRNLGLGENAMNSIIQFVSGIVTNGGSYNLGLGYNSGTALTTGDNNSFAGYQSGAATTTAGNNTGYGYNTLATNITGHSNIAIGSGALDVPDAEDYNIAIGRSALGGSIAGGEKNIAIGYTALDVLTISDKTVAIGHSAGGGITGGSGTNGSENTLIGYQAGDALTTGENCVIIGSDADASAVGAANQIVIGKGAVGLADNSVVLGNTDITAWLPPDDAGVDLGSSSYQFKDAYIHGTLEADAITINGTAIGSIYSPVAGHSSIATVGTIGTGTWQGTAIASTYIAGDAITGAKIADDAIDSEHYTDGSIDNAHIADNAIDSEHYADGSIDNAHIADNAIDSEHYADGSIDNAHLADDAVNSDELAAGAVDDAHLSDGVATGLAGAGTTATSGVLNVIGGTGITANANDIAIDSTVTTLTGSQTLTNKTLTAPTINGWKADIVTASSTTLTTAQSGSYVIWTGGTCTLPASCVAGTQFTIFNNTGSSATVGLGGSNSILSGWASNAAVADHDATSYVAISSTNWVQVGA